MTWQMEAACRGADPDLWFPINEDARNASDAERVARAKDICSACPVKAECLEFAFEHACHFGVWGGLTSGERAKLIRRGGHRAEKKLSRDEVLVEQARRGEPVSVGFEERRRIIAALPNEPEVRLARVFNVSDKTIYNDRAVLRGETPWSRAVS